MRFLKHFRVKLACVYSTGNNIFAKLSLHRCTYMAVLAVHWMFLGCVTWQMPLEGLQAVRSNPLLTLCPIFVLIAVKSYPR